MKTLNVYSNGQWQEVVGSPSGLEDYAKIEYVDAAIAAIPPTDLSGYYTKPETDAAIKACRDEGALDLDAVQNQVLFAVTETARQLQERIDLKANASEYVKLNDKDQVALTRGVIAATYAFGDDLNPDVAIKAKLVDGAIRLVFTPGGNKQEVVTFQSDAAADLSAYAKITDKDQGLLAKTVVSQAYGFGDTSQPLVALAYTDTGEGYGNRLVLNVGLTNEFLVYKSDLEPLNALLPRIEAIESKAAPVVDLAPYVTLVDADARYAPKGTAYTKVECDSKFLTLVDINQFAYRADVYTQKQTDDRFMRITDAFSKADFDNQMALFLYSRKQVDDKLTAISPLGSPSINDPALADFKKSVLDAVALMLAGGGKQPPADIGWTKCLNANGVGNHAAAEVRMIGGVMEFKGVLSTGSISGSQNIIQIPASFPLPELACSYPVAARLVGSNAVYAYVNFYSTNRVVGVTMAGTINELTITGLRVKAAY